MELNVDQMRIVNSKPNGHTLIKGVAGSGKTTVAVSKISMLANYYMGKEDKILFVTYNKTLIKYTQYLLKDINIQQNIFFSFDIEKHLDIKTIDSIISQYGGKLRPYRKFANEEQRKSAMKKSICKVKEKYPQLELISDKNYSFINEEIDWLKSCRYIERETYLNIDRVGRMSKGENRYRLMKNSDERKAIFDIYLYYERILERNEQIDYKTNAIRVLEAFRNGELRPKLYRHIIVDESQDLTRVQLEIIKYLYDGKENSSIMFIADVSQSIYVQSWLSGQSFKSIGFDMSGKSNILSKNYRTTYEIAKAAYSLIEKDDTMNQNDIFVKPVAIDRHGDAPCYKCYGDEGQEAEGIANQIKQLVGRYSLKDIVVVAANKVYLENIQSVLVKKGIQAEVFKKSEINFEEEVVRLYTLHSIKGLEFPVLFIAGINEGILPYSEEMVSIGRRMLYVGMTRAKQELYLSSAGNKSVFMDELDNSLLRNSETDISPLYKVEISDYLFKEKINDIYSKEERVRQWFIKEMMIKLGYPKENIDIEYPVQFFSKCGFVDIVLCQYKNNKREPYIMVETKKPGEDIDKALKQLRSYAACCPLAEYIVVTDGINTIMENIQNRHYVPVKSLPPYKEKECNIYEEYDYTSWESKKHYIYAVNMEDKEEILLKDYTTGEVIEYSSYHSIHVIGQVAAGVLKYANVERVAAFLFPDLLASERNELFMLKVQGDSMIDFQINDGDYVLIKKQNYARNGDIVVAGRRGENQVTLKQYCNFDGNVGLMPGNSNYKPIIIPEQELFINGVLTGILSHCKNR